MSHNISRNQQQNAALMWIKFAKAEKLKSGVKTALTKLKKQLALEVVESLARCAPRSGQWQNCCRTSGKRCRSVHAWMRASARYQHGLFSMPSRGPPMWGLGCCRISGFFHSQNKNKCHCAPVRRGHGTPERSRSKGHDRRGREPHRSCRGSVGDSQGAPFGTSTLAMQIRRENITLSP